MKTILCYITFICFIFTLVIHSNVQVLAQQVNRVSGTVSSISQNSILVRVGEVNETFFLDSNLDFKRNSMRTNLEALRVEDSVILAADSKNVIYSIEAWSGRISNFTNVLIPSLILATLFVLFVVAERTLYAHRHVFALTPQPSH